MLDLSRAPNYFIVGLISGHSSVARLSRWGTFDLYTHPLHSFVKSPLLSYHPPKRPMTLLLLLFLWGKRGLRCLQKSLVSGALTAGTNFSMKFISHENSFSWAVAQRREELNYVKHKFLC